MILVAVEFDCEATIVVALDDQIDRKRSHLHLWLDAVAKTEQAAEHIALEPRLAERHEVPSWLRPPLHRVFEVPKNLRLEVIWLLSHAWSPCGAEPDQGGLFDRRDQLQVGR